MITFSNLGNYGHLGNQMFQYAALRGIAANRGLDWAIPMAEEFGSRYPLRSSIYDCFKMGSVTEENRTIEHSNVTVSEAGFEFDESLYNNCPDNVDLNGYFQTEKYFKDITDIIKSDFNFKDSVLNKAEILLKDIDVYNSVSIHVRRTDYINHSAHHTNLPTEFYTNIINSLGKIDKVVVFSDDINWCRAQFPDDGSYIFSEQDAYTDMCAMSMCRTNILANSSFSWWAGWLNQWPNNLVIAPSNWFGPANIHLSTKDLLPSRWIKI